MVNESWTESSGAMQTDAEVTRQLRILKSGFGLRVRQMGPWNSDGTFGYSSVFDLVVALSRFWTKYERDASRRIPGSDSRTHLNLLGWERRIHYDSYGAEARQMLRRTSLCSFGRSRCRNRFTPCRCCDRPIPARNPDATLQHFYKRHDLCSVGNQCVLLHFNIVGNAGPARSENRIHLGSWTKQGPNEIPKGCGVRFLCSEHCCYLPIGSR